MAGPIEFGFGLLRNKRVYGERDFFGAEEPAQSISDFTGFNEVARLTRDVRSDLLAEHFVNGVHNTPLIPRVFLDLRYDWRGTPSYSAGTFCYSQDGAGDVLTGAAVLDSPPIRNAAGDVTIKLAHTLPTTQLALLSMTPGLYGQSSFLSRVWLYQVIDSQTIRVYRRQWTHVNMTGLAYSDGDMQFCIAHAAAGSGAASGLVQVPDVISADCAPTDEHWELARTSYRSMREALLEQHSGEGLHRAYPIPVAVGLVTPTGEQERSRIEFSRGWRRSPINFTDQTIFTATGAAMVFDDLQLRSSLVYGMHVSTIARAGWTATQTLHAAQGFAYKTDAGGQRWRGIIGGSQALKHVAFVAWGIPVARNEAGLPPFDHELAAETAITPDALAPWAEWSDEYLARFEVRHTPDGDHDDLLVPVAAAHVAGNGTVIWTQNCSVARQAVGRYRYTLASPMDTSGSWFAVPYPVATDGSAAADFAIESERSFTKTATVTEVEILNQAAALVDREHLVFFFGRKDGGI